MARTSLVAVVATATLLANSSASATEVLYHRFTPGEGATNCSHWREVRAGRPQEARTSEAWVLGFATALNAYTDKRGGMQYRLSNDELFLAIDERCARYPSADVGDVATSILHARAEAASK